MSKFSRRGFLKGGLAAGGAAAVIRPEGAQAMTPEPPPVADEVGIICTVNGQATKQKVHPDDSALDLVRDRLGLTGSKKACGHGACGACTMLVDGRPNVTCLLPATSLDQSEVTTIEGIAQDGALHPMQKAFAGEDGLQCGFCTPGFVVEATAFYDSWRADNGKTEPSRAQVADALEGHLCRCGAYEGIYRAVQAACVGTYDGDVPPPARVDAIPKVTGAATYTVDVQLPDMLHMAVLRASHAAGVFKSADLDAARAIAGVAAVYQVTGDGQRIRFSGQELIAVAAKDLRTAHAAVHALTPDIDAHPIVTGFDDAMKANAPTVYDSAKEDMPLSAEAPATPAKLNGNVRGPSGASFFAKPKKARKKLDAAKGTPNYFEETYELQTQAHTTMEPHAVVAQWTGESLVVHLSTQGVHVLAEEIAETWDLDPENVQVIAPYVGGGFGAKAVLKIEARMAIELARLSGGRPVRYEPDRAEEITIGGCRPAQRVRVEALVNDAGELEVLGAQSYSNSGVSVGNASAILLRVLYPTELNDLVDYDVTTNGPPSQAFRGPGGPAPLVAMESMVDKVAKARGEDRLEVRKRWDRNPVRKMLYPWVESLDVWQRRSPGDTGRYRRGVGLANAAWPVFVERRTRIELSAGPSGIVARSATQDMGNGVRTVIANAVAERMGLQPHQITVQIGDSHAPPGPLSGGSRSTLSLIPAAWASADALMEELVERAEELGMAGNTDWMELASKGPKISVIGKRPNSELKRLLPVSIAGLSILKKIAGAIMLTELEIDTRLGRVRPLGCWMGVGAGRIISPTLARSQVEGGVIQGLSYALYEDRRLDPNTGIVLAAGLEDYRIAGIGDIPPITVHFEERGFEDVAGGSVGLAELVTVPAVASVGNAVHDALGVAPTVFPIRPDTVLEALS